MYNPTKGWQQDDPKVMSEEQNNSFRKASIRESDLAPTKMDRREIDSLEIRISREKLLERLINLDERRELR